jgi:hypothetical protein
MRNKTQNQIPTSSRLIQKINKKLVSESNSKTHTHSAMNTQNQTLLFLNTLPIIKENCVQETHLLNRVFQRDMVPFFLEKGS